MKTYIYHLVMMSLGCYIVVLHSNPLDDVFFASTKEGLFVSLGLMVVSYHIFYLIIDSKS
jgi:hypothetical protein